MFGPNVAVALTDGTNDDDNVNAVEPLERWTCPRISVYIAGAIIQISMTCLVSANAHGYEPATFYMNLIKYVTTHCFRRLLIEA